MQSEKPRPSFEDIYMTLAHKMSERSTCRRLNVGCVITSPDFRKVIAVGYNGGAAGDKNDCDRVGEEAVGNCGHLHAEENAAINCDVPRATPKVVFCTNLPCLMCFASGTRVSSPSRIQRAYRRWYEGPMIRVVTRNDELSVTPNHPVLSLGRGFSAVERLNKGDYLLHSIGNERSGAGSANNQDAHVIEQVFESLASTSFTVRSSGARHQFHGDGLPNTDVDVVTADCSLENYRQSGLLELPEEPTFTRSDTRRVKFILERTSDLTGARRLRDRSGGFLQSASDYPSVYFVSESEALDRLTAFIRCNDLLYREWDAASTQVLSATLSALAQNAEWAKTVLNGSARNTTLGRKVSDFVPSEIAADEIIHIERYNWAGHVYNLQTTNGWYYAGASRIIVQNCAKRLVNLGGVERVYYDHDYRNHDSLDLLVRVGIKVGQFTPRAVRVDNEAREKLERDYIQVVENLTSVQARCTELLLENRKLRGVG